MQRQQAAGRPSPASGQISTIDDLIKKHGPEIALALPQHVTPERLLRIALSEVRRNPKLGKCSAPSLLGAIFTCAQLGLEPGGALGHCYLIPYGNECQFQIGYKGMIELARRSGQILSLSARAVYENDRFSYDYGLNEDLQHRPAIGHRGELTYAYAVAKLKDGGVQFEVMDRAELEEVRDGSQGYQNARKYNSSDTPWISSFDEMCRKTVIRRLFKYLPVSVEVTKAASLDEHADRGQRQETDIDHLLLPAEVPAEAPAIAAAAAPVATLTEQQQAAIQTALQRQLTSVGRDAFVVDACVSFEVEALSEIPAEHHTALMQSLGNAGNRERWNRGCGHANGEALLTAEQIAELTQAPETAEEAPQQQPEATLQRAAKPTPKAAVAAAPEPVQEDAAGQGEAGDDGDDVQAQVM
jgi:recombination protein RecT